MFEIEDIEKTAMVNELVSAMKDSTEVEQLYSELVAGEMSEADFELEAWNAIKDTFKDVPQEYRALSLSRAVNRYLLGKGYRS